MNEQQIAVKINPEVFNKLPALVFISGIAEVEMGKSPDVAAIKAYLESSWAGLQQKIADQSSPEFLRVQQWSEALKAAGVKVKDFPPSIQAISKRALKGGPPFSINPIVDTYNAISMEMALPLGAYDVADLKGDLPVRLSGGGEQFTALGSVENDPTVGDEIVFSDDESILTRMFLWRQSDKSKIKPETKKFIFVNELLSVMGENLPNEAKAKIEEKMSSLLGVRISNVSIQSKLA